MSDSAEKNGAKGVSSIVGSLWPTVSLSVSVVNDNPVVDDWGLCVQGLSKLRYVITAQAHVLSVIKSYSFTFAGQSFQSATGVTAPISLSGMLTPKASAVDSKMLRTTVEGDPIEVLAYHAPQIRHSSVCRCDSEGNETDGGAYLKVSCLAECSELDGRNVLTVRARYRPAGGTYGGYTILQNGVAATVGGGLDSHRSYEVELSAVDTVGTERTINYVASTASVAFHLRAGGNGAAFGKYTESNGLECAWDASFSGDVAVGGELSAHTLQVGGKNLVDWIYPVGAIYLSTAATNPAILFGGVWQAIEDRFLLAAGTAHAALSTGGEASHTLTVEEMPSHSHDITVDGDGEHSHYIENYSSVESWGLGALESWGDGSGISRDVYTDSDGYHTHTAYADYTGDGEAFDLMPPYLTVYMWKRIS